ncbi:MAG: lysophospholipase [Salinivirgaceae bacterium]|nr:lysophospholipase [Salinivirgaceae bacterium]
MIQSQTYWHTPNGYRLFGSIWKPENEVKALVVLVHGFGEHCLRYTPYIEHFTQAGIAFVGSDLQGHGQSDGKRGKILSYDSLLDEVSLVLNEAQTLFPDLPTFIYGHSMGGNIVLNYLLKRKPVVAGGIVTSPWLVLADDPNFITKRMVSFIKRIFPHLTIDSGLEIAYISTDPEEVKKYRDDKLNHGRISFRLFAEITRHGLWAIHHTKNLQVPVLLMHGTSDKITSCQASELASHGCPEFIEWAPWEGRYHELHNETNRSEVAAKAIDWILKHLR